MEKGDIELVVSDTVLNFPKNISQPIVLFLEKRRFSRMLDMMNLRKHLNKTPCFVAEMKGGNVIYFCEEIVSDLIKNFNRENKKKFIEAITLHELFHIWNNFRVSNNQEAIFSENLVWQEMENLYPKHYKFLIKFAKR